MKTSSLGRSGVAVSSVGLGGFELGPDEGHAPDVDTAVRVIETALDAGIDWLDTSENYNDTQNESLIGAALARSSGHMMISTKAAPTPLLTGGGSGFKRDQIHMACRASLTRLGRDTIDMYLLHWPDDTGVPLDETWGAMSELVDAGLVRAIGLSNYDLTDVERCHKLRSVDVVQDGLSLIDYLDARYSFARCRDLGIGVMAWVLHQRRQRGDRRQSRWSARPRERASCRSRPIDGDRRPRAANPAGTDLRRELTGR